MWHLHITYLSMSGTWVALHLNDTLPKYHIFERVGWPFIYRIPNMRSMFEEGFGDPSTYNLFFIILSWRNDWTTILFFSIIEDTILWKKDKNLHLQTIQVSPSLSCFFIHYHVDPSFSARRVDRPFYLYFYAWPKEGVATPSYYIAWESSLCHNWLEKKVREEKSLLPSSIFQSHLRDLSLWQFTIVRINHSFFSPFSDCTWEISSSGIKLMKDIWRREREFSLFWEWRKEWKLLPQSFLTNVI